jgi:type IV secretory pathway TrbD component
MPMWKRWAALAALPMALVLSGCELRGDVAVSVDGDGGGALSYTLAADDELRAEVRRAGADPLEALAEAGRQLPGWKVTQQTDGPVQGVTLTTAFADPEELTRLSTQFAEALAGPELRPLGPLHLELDDTTVELQGSAVLDVDRAVRDLGVRPRRARRVLDEHVLLRVVARMPGEVLQTNADEQRDDGTVVWTITGGEQRDLRVLARRPWTLARVAGLLVTPTGLTALAVVTALLGLVIWRVATRRRRRATAGVPPDQAFAPSRSARIRARSVRT